VPPVVDPVVVAQLCDKVVLVVRWGSTARELVKECIGKISGHRKIAGVAFNQVNDRLARKYGKYAVSDYYGNRHYKKYYNS
jgi:polysaccharide biosynthesis transport protein